MTNPPRVRRRIERAVSLRPRTEPAELSDGQLTAWVMSPLARCARAAMDPDDWFPVTATLEGARAEARHALAMCAVCPVRAECLELSLRHWRTIGRHGIWGGLVEAERAAARRQWLTGSPVTALLRSGADSHISCAGAASGRGPRAPLVSSLWRGHTR
jgi:hypothetical protein